MGKYQYGLYTVKIGSHKFFTRADNRKIYYVKIKLVNIFSNEPFIRTYYVKAKNLKDAENEAHKFKNRKVLSESGQILDIHENKRETKKLNKLM